MQIQAVTSCLTVSLLLTWHVLTMRPILKFMPHIKMTDTVTPALQALVLWSVLLVALTVRPVAGAYTPLIATLMMAMLVTAWLGHDVLVALYLSGGDSQLVQDLKSVYSCSVLVPDVDMWKQQICFYMMGTVSVIFAFPSFRCTHLRRDLPSTTWWHNASRLRRPLPLRRNAARDGPASKDPTCFGRQRLFWSDGCRCHPCGR